MTGLGRGRKYEKIGGEIQDPRRWDSATGRRGDRLLERK